MDAVEFLTEARRMCQTYGCSQGCPAFIEGDGCALGLDENKTTPVSGAVHIVEQWSKRHPLVTNADKFHEVFGIEPTRAGYLTGHVKALGISEEWWNKPYKEPEEE